MIPAVQSVHHAYRAAADLSAPRVPTRDELDWRTWARELNEPMDVRADPLIAGALRGAWIQIS